ncbi:hypothetical protein PIB30_107961, partial [Stylosanthes scabra]|nr:hypothetical protein [Stylosanthes scabra]
LNELDEFRTQAYENSLIYKERARQARQEAPPPQQPPQVHPQPQFHQQQEIPSSFYTHFDASMSQIYRRLDQQQEENRKNFEAINTRMDRMDDQLSFLCYSNQMVNETMYYPYKNTARQFREMEAQGVPVTIANLAIHRHREEEMNRERIRHNQTVQKAAAERVREANKGKVMRVHLGLFLASISLNYCDNLGVLLLLIDQSNKLDVI